MPVTGYMMSNFPHNLCEAKVSDLSAGGTTVKCCLMTNLAAPNQETWTSYADVVTDGNEHGAVGGYATGGVACAAKTMVEAAKVSTFDAADASWGPGATILCRHALVYDDTPVANADKKLLGWWDLGADYGVTGGTFKLTWNAAGILTITVS